MTSNLGPQCVFAAGDTFLTNTPKRPQGCYRSDNTLTKTARIAFTTRACCAGAAGLRAAERALSGQPGRERRCDYRESSDFRATGLSSRRLAAHVLSAPRRFGSMAFALLGQT